MGKTARFAAMLCVALSGVPASGALAQAQFYKGKTINLIVGYDAGGGNDVRSRVVARYLEKHIPGNPKIVVQNMPGASGVVQVNYMYRLAKPDGLTIGDINREAAYVQVAGRPGVQFNFADFQWMGGLTQQPTIVFIRSSLPYQTIDDLKKATSPINFGARQIGATNYLAAKALEALDVPVKIVLGYSGPKFNLAFEQNEVEASGLTLSSFADRPQWIRPGGLARFILTLGDNREPGVAYGPDLKPNPAKAELYRIVNLALGLPNGTYGAPPSTPPERVAELQKAFKDMTDDPQFKEDIQKIGVALEFMDGPTVGEHFKRFVNSSPEAKKNFSELLE